DPAHETGRAEGDDHEEAIEECVLEEAADSVGIAGLSAIAAGTAADRRPDERRQSEQGEDADHPLPPQAKNGHGEPVMSQPSSPNTRRNICSCVYSCESKGPHPYPIANSTRTLPRSSAISLSSSTARLRSRPTPPICSQSLPDAGSR